MGISTHILDTSRGKPAAGIGVLLSLHKEEGWTDVGRGLTDDDGRCRDLLTGGAAGDYRLHFDTAPYFTELRLRSLYPFVEISFTVSDPEQHFHIPLLLTANGYTTYRGS